MGSAPRHKHVFSIRILSSISTICVFLDVRGWWPECYTSICWNSGLESNGILEWTYRILSQRFIPSCKLSMFHVNFRKIHPACKNGLISVSYGLVCSQCAGTIARRASSQSCIAGRWVVFICFTAENRSGVLNVKLSSWFGRIAAMWCSHTFSQCMGPATEISIFAKKQNPFSPYFAFRTLYCLSSKARPDLSTISGGNIKGILWMINKQVFEY